MFRLMVITAHPDDEAANFGGALRIYADRGVETCLLCLTPGQAAANRGGAKDDRELAAMRRRELAAACEILKVKRCAVLDFPDSQLYRQDLYRVVHDVTLQVREFRPQVILTFGPEGGVTSHMDHSIASLCATLAFHWAGRENRFPDQLGNGRSAYRPQKLHYSTSDATLADRPPVALPPITAVIDIGAHLDTKIAAFKAHATQAALWPQVEKRLLERKQFEKFHLAASVHPGPVEMEGDLFAGVSED